MKHHEHRTKREFAEAVLFSAFMKGFVLGIVVGAGLGGIALAAAAGWWMLT